MLKHKVKSLQKDIKRITTNKMNGVYFVHFWDEVFAIQAAGGKTIFQGSREEYNSFIKNYEKAVFIIDDIPRPSGELTLSDWAN